MSVTFPTISGASLGTAASSTLTIDLPAGAVSGNTLVCYIICSANTVITPVESGWTTDVTAAGIRSYSRIAGGSEPASYGFTRASNLNNIQGVMVRAQGSHPSTPVQTVGGSPGGSGTTTVLPTLTVTDGFTLLQICNVQAATTYTPPAGPTELFDQQFATQNFASAVGREVVGAGATGTKTWTHGTGVRAGVMYAIRSAPAATGSFTGSYNYAGNYGGQAGPGEGSFVGGYNYAGNFVGDAPGVSSGAFTGGYDYTGNFIGSAPTPTGDGDVFPAGRDRFTARRTPANRRRSR
jgi:hypothetical protein